MQASSRAHLFAALLSYGSVVVEVDRHQLDQDAVPEVIDGNILRFEFGQDKNPGRLDNLRAIFPVDGVDHFCTIPWDAVLAMFHRNDGAVVAWIDREYYDPPDVRIVEFDVMDGGFQGEGPLPGPRPDLRLVHSRT